MTRRFDWKFVALIVLLLALAALRFFCLGADSPEPPFWVYDEGHWLHNARNHILFHRWIVDDFNQGLTTPVFTALVSVGFRLFGVGIVQARAVSVVVGLVTQLALYRWIRVAWGKYEAVFATILFSCSSTMFDYNRLALPETALLLCLIVAGWMWSRADRGSAYALASGVAFIAACLTKPTAVFFFPIPFLLSMLEPEDAGRFSWTDRVGRLFRRPQRTRLGLFLLGCVGVAAIGLVVGLASGLLKTSVGMEALLAWGKAPESLPRMTARLMVLPIRHFFQTVSVMMLLSSLYVMQRCADVARGVSFQRRGSSVEVMAILWFALAMLFIGSVTFYADRYMVMLIPPLCILGARAIADAGARRLDDDAERSSPLGAMPTALIVMAIIAPFVTLLAQTLKVFFGSTEFGAVPGDVAGTMLIIFAKEAVSTIVVGAFLIAGFLRMRGRMSLSSVVAAYPAFLCTWAVLSVTAFLLGRHVHVGLSEGLSMESSAAIALLATLSLAVVALRTWVPSQLPNLVRRAPILAVASCLIVNGVGIGTLFADRTYTVLAAAREMRPYLHRGSVILGDIADTLSLESEAASVRMYLGMNQHAFERFHPDYVIDSQLNTRSDVPPTLSNQYTEQGASLRLVRRFGLLPLDRQGTAYNFIVNLYDVPNLKRTE